MKASELRIGNRVNVKNYKTIALENIHLKGCTIGSEQYLISMLEPIPLTEDWLVNKSDFNKIGVNFIDKNDFVIYTRRNGEFVYRGQYEVILKHVHQLQNLYFALTNKELTINN